MLALLKEEGKVVHAKKMLDLPSHIYLGCHHYVWYEVMPMLALEQK